MVSFLYLRALHGQFRQTDHYTLPPVQTVDHHATPTDPVHIFGFILP